MMPRNAIVTILILVLALGRPALAQGDGDTPSYAGLSSSGADLAATVRELTRRMEALERRVAELDGGGLMGLNSGPSAPIDSALIKLVQDTKRLMDALKAALDGHNFADPNDSRVTYHLVKKPAWSGAKENIDTFVSSMGQILEKSEQLDSDPKATFVSMIRWGRGKVLYKAGFSPEQKEVLPVDFGAAVVPVPPRPPQAER